jgi:hypothetical protein
MKDIPKSEVQYRMKKSVEGQIGDDKDIEAHGPMSRNVRILTGIKKLSKGRSKCLMRLSRNCMLKLWERKSTYFVIEQ